MFKLVYECESEGRVEFGPFEDLQSVSRWYCDRRDESGEGASTFGFGVVYDHSTGARTHIISYNGKVWDVTKWPTSSDVDAYNRAYAALGMMVYNPYA